MGRRLDWVQNHETYTDIAYNFSVGQVQSFGLPLTYSRHALPQGMMYTGVANAPVDWAAGVITPNAEKRMWARAVHGHINLEPTTWAAGNIMRAGFRLTVQDMDHETTAMTVEEGYTMWVGPSADGDDAYVFADEPFLWERRIEKYYASSSDNAHFAFNFRWRGRKLIEPNKALFLYCEAPSTASVNMRIRGLFCRTLLEY